MVGLRQKSADAVVESADGQTVTVTWPRIKSTLSLPYSRLTIVIDVVTSIIKIV